MSSGGNVCWRSYAVVFGEQHQILSALLLTSKFTSPATSEYAIKGILLSAQDIQEYIKLVEACGSLHQSSSSNTVVPLLM